MTTPYRHRKVLTYSTLILMATGLPLVIPFFATSLSRVLDVPVRLAYSDSLLATFGIFAAWFVTSRLIDVILDSSDIGGTMTGHVVSAAASLVLLGGGYFLIVDSALIALLMAVVVCGLLFAVGITVDRGFGTSPRQASHVR